MQIFRMPHMLFFQHAKYIHNDIVIQHDKNVKNVKENG